MASGVKSEQAGKLTFWQHPDTLYDAEYQAHTVDVGDYRPAVTRLSGESRRGGDVDVVFANGRVLKVASPQPGTLRLRILSPGQAGPSLTESLGLTDFGTDVGNGGDPLSVQQTGTTTRITSPTFALTVDSLTGDLEVLDGAGRPVWQTRNGGVRLADAPGGPFFCESRIHDDERFFGFGGRIASPDRTGSSVDVFSVKAGLRSGDYGGFPVPFFVSTRGYGFFLNNPSPHVYFDMGRTRADRWSLHAPGGDCDITLIAGPATGDVIRRYTAITGRVPPVPRWALGFWCSSLEFRSAEQAVADARRLRAEGYPCDVFVFDGPWRGGKDFAAFYAATQQYPSGDMNWHPDFGDGPAMIKALDELHVKTVLHLNSRNYAPETREKGLAAGLLRQHGQEVVVRVLHEPAEAYYESMISPRAREGVAMWWTDHSDRVSGELAPGIPSRNLFGPLWNRLLSHIMARHGVAGHLSLSRGGGIGSQRYAIPWPGDTRCGVDALADDIWFMLGAGLAGFALTSVDLGGFAPRKNPKTDYESEAAIQAEMFDDENICRRVCHCLLFTPVPRIHNNWATPPKLPWNCHPQVQDLYRRALQERYRLTPYLYSYAMEAARTGEPLMRPLAYHHPGDASAIAATTSFYLGEWLLIAPITEAGRQQWDVYLPEGRWVDLWTDAVYDGPAVVTVAAPLRAIQGLPIFVRAGAILPRQAVTPFLGDAPPGELELEVYPGRRATRFELSDSSTHVSVLACTPTSAGYSLQLRNGLDSPRQFTLLLPAADNPSVTCGGKALEGEQTHNGWGLPRFRVGLSLGPGASETIEVRTAQAS